MLREDGVEDDVHVGTLGGSGDTERQCAEDEEEDFWHQYSSTTTDTDSFMFSDESGECDPDGFLSDVMFDSEAEEEDDYDEGHDEGHDIDRDGGHDIDHDMDHDGYRDVDYDEDYEEDHVGDYDDEAMRTFSAPRLDEYSYSRSIEAAASFSGEPVRGPDRFGSYTSPGVPTEVPIRWYSGHRNAETLKDVSFFGDNDEYIMSGSDDGLLFIWDKATSRIVTMLRGDQRVVNAMAANPHTNTLAVSGTDSTVKIFEPFGSEYRPEAEEGKSKRVDMSQESKIREKNRSATRNLRHFRNRGRDIERTMRGMEDPFAEDDPCRMQ